MLKAINEIQQQSNNVGCTQMFNFRDNLFFYTTNLPAVLSPFLLLITIFAFCLASKIGA